MTGPLQGIRVVDLTSVISGPASASILADQGADVIKVEALAGDMTRHSRTLVGDFPPMFISVIRGKRAIALDLKKPAGCDILWRLLETADVVVQNFRPGAIERLGFGADAVRARNPKIVYMSISGVGETGPYAAKRVYDPLIQALSGLADIQSDPLTGRPKMVRTLIADKTTAIYAAQAITAALFHRSQTGEGQHVRLSMLDTMLSYLWPEGMNAYAVPAEDAPDARNTPHDMIFATSDGYITVGANSDKEWADLCNGLNKPDWLADERFKTQALRSKNRQPRLLLLEEVLLTNTVSHWLDVFDTADVPCAPVLPRRAIAEHPQVIANNSVVTLDHPGVGPIRQARPAARFEQSPAAIHGNAPYLGEHTREILTELGFDAETIDSLAADHVIKCHAAP